MDSITISISELHFWKCYVVYLRGSDHLSDAVRLKTFRLVIKLAVNSLRVLPFRGFCHLKEPHPQPLEVPVSSVRHRWHATISSLSAEPDLRPSVAGCRDVN